jgi:hypothetical protein
LLSPTYYHGDVVAENLHAFNVLSVDAAQRWVTAHPNCGSPQLISELAFTGHQKE